LFGAVSKSSFSEEKEAKRLSFTGPVLSGKTGARE
jgi:hypothetical protein